jgi:hypothetical protein
VQNCQRMHSRYSDGLLAVRMEFHSRQGNKIFLLSTVTIPAVGSTQPLMQLIPENLNPGVKRSGREADYLPPSSAEARNCRIIPPLPHTSSLCFSSLTCVLYASASCHYCLRPSTSSIYVLPLTCVLYLEEYVTLFEIYLHILTSFLCL